MTSSVSSSIQSTGPVSSMMVDASSSGIICPMSSLPMDASSRVSIGIFMAM